jgi:EAL domain-containing protein (putative c-di-GMP-specific phosphodiesterase class I)
LSPSPAKAKASCTTASVETVTPESLGKQLRAALPPVRLHSVSLYNADGDVLWLSEGALGPDEHGVVLDAIQVLHTDNEKPYHETGLEDGRFGIFLPVRAPRGDLVGMAMLLTELKALPDGIGEQLTGSKVRTALQKIAVFLRLESTRAGQTTPTPTMPSAAGPSPPADGFLTLELLEDEPAPAPTPIPSAAPAPMLFKPAAPSRPRPQGSPEPPSLTLEEVAGDLALSVQELVKLRSSGRTRRYEVLARSRRDAGRNHVPDAFIAGSAHGPDGARLDDLVLQQLFGWLANHPQTWDGEPASFSVNLSIGSLEDESFLEGVAAALKTAAVPAGSIGFELTEFACVQCKRQVQRFLAQCETLGCFVVLDNFTFDSAALPLLTSRALRMVKIDPKLTAAAMREKLAQAIVIAISQACKVLGIHCIAKKVETQAALDWLEAVGCDFAQGFALEMPLSLDSLAAPSPTLPRNRGKEGKRRT